MEDGWLSVEQVAERLGLHVRTVRGYIRDGRLPAVRIGKQYRIAPADLNSFTGRPAATTRPSAEVSAVVETDNIDAATADRLSTLVIAYGQVRRDSEDPLRVQAMYDSARARLKVIIMGGVADTAALLQAISDILGAQEAAKP